MNAKNNIFFFCSVMIFTLLACGTTQSGQPNSTSPTAQLTKSKVVVPTATKKIQIESHTLAATAAPDMEFNPANASQVLPDDILKEISYFSTGGGGTCDGTQKYVHPMIAQNPAGGELLTQSTFTVCGWKDGEVISGTITYPDGRTATQTISAELDTGTGAYYGTLQFKPGLDDPEGKYNFAFEGSSGKVQSAATFYKPQGIRLYRMDDTHILLYGFQPAEMVKVFYYYGGQFVSWQGYRMDASGNLSIRFSGKESATDKNILFVAIGEDSGEVRSLNDSYWGRGAENWVENLSIKKNFCEGFSSRLAIGIRAQVAFTDGSNMRIRAKPGFDQEILYKIPEGTIIRIIRGPKCKDNSIWWYAMTDDGLEGWMAELQNGVHLLDLYNP